jgi:hypothetical protein
VGGFAVSAGADGDDGREKTAKIIDFENPERNGFLAINQFRVDVPDGKLDILKIRPLARLGYYDYTSVESIFEMTIPGPDEKLQPAPCLSKVSRRTGG